MSMIVLGGAGYIGAHTVAALAEAGEDVAVVDNLQSGHRAAIHDRARFYQGDIRNRDFLKIVFRKERPDVILHFATLADEGWSAKHPVACYDCNLAGTMSLLDAMQESKVARLVFSSTAAVYSSGDHRPKTEKSLLSPSTAHAESLLATEHLLKWYEQANGLHHVIFRYYHAAGAHQGGSIGEVHQPETHLIPLLCKTALGQRPKLEIYGGDYQTPDGTCVRDYLHVSDVARGHVLAARYLARGGKSAILNLGNDHGFSVREILNAAETVIPEPVPYAIGMRKYRVPDCLTVDSSKAKRLLSWMPQQSTLAEILTTAWQFHSAHPNGYEEARKNNAPVFPRYAAGGR